MQILRIREIKLFISHVNQKGISTSHFLKITKIKLQTSKRILNN